VGSVVSRGPPGPYRLPYALLATTPADLVEHLVYQKHISREQFGCISRP